MVEYFEILEVFSMNVEEYVVEEIKKLKIHREINKLKKRAIISTVGGSLVLYLGLSCVLNKYVSSFDSDLYYVEADIKTYEDGELLSTVKDEKMGFLPELEVSKEAFIQGEWTVNDEGIWQRNNYIYDLSDVSDDAKLSDIDWNGLDVISGKSEYKTAITDEEINEKNVVKIYKYSQDMNDSIVKRFYDGLNIVIMASLLVYILSMIKLYYDGKKNIMLSRKRESK